jgi:hypothetical protein
MTTKDTPARYNGPQHHTSTAAAMNKTAVRTHCRWPVPFWPPSARRELNLHNLITSTGLLRTIVATAAADHAAKTVQTPANAVWWLHGRGGGPLHLVQRVSRWEECRTHLITTFTTFISKELSRCCSRLRQMRPTTLSPEGHGRNVPRR